MAEEKKKNVDEEEEKKIDDKKEEKTKKKDEIDDNTILSTVNKLQTSIDKLLGKLDSGKSDEESNIPKLPKKVDIKEEDEEEKEKETQDQKGGNKRSILNRIFIGD